MQDKVTTLLDALGLLLIAAGVGAGLYPFLEWWAVSIAGLIVLLGSGAAAWQARRPRKGSTA